MFVYSLNEQSLFFMSILLIQYEHKLVLPAISSSDRSKFILRWILVLMAFMLPFLFRWRVLFILWLLVLPAIKTWWNYFKLPSNFHKRILYKSDNKVYVGKRQFYLDDLLFLSFREDENYRIIRLEVKRNALMIPNESVLITNCSGLDEALRLCRIVKNFIHPSLLINHIKIGYGKAKVENLYESGSREGLRFDVWEYIE